MTAAITGLVHDYGEDGTGKTILGITASDDPSRIEFLDDDAGKGREIAIGYGIPMKQYHDLFSESTGMNELVFHSHIVKLVQSLPDNSRDLILFDNAKRFFNGARAYVAANTGQFRTAIRGKDAEMIAGIQKQVATEEWLPRFYTLLRSKAKCVIITSHERDIYENSIKTGARGAAADNSLRKAANLIIRLTKDKYGKSVPVGLVIKNVAVFRDGRPVRALPQRIERCDWNTIRDYLANPIGDRDPLPHEVPDEFETALIEGSLTKEQRRQYDMNLRLALLQANPDLTGAVQSLITQGVTAPPMILKQLKEQGIETDMGAVNSIIKAMNEA